MPSKITKQQVEERTQRLGREMFARTRAASAGPLRYEWWEERMMQQFMQYEWLKVQAFRFIDAMPTLNSPVEVARHMREYFVHPQYLAGRNGHARSAQEEQAAALAELEPQKLDHRLYRLVSWLMDFRRLDSASARFFVWLSRKTLAMMAGGFIAGQNVDEAVKAIRKMRKDSLAFTIDVLGEAAVSAGEAEDYLERYMTLVAELPGHAAQWNEVPLIDAADGTPIPRVNVSVKITSLYPGFDPLPAEAAKRRAKEILRPLLRKAMDGGVHLHIDMEHYAIKDLTLELFEELLIEDEFRDYPHFGIVLQAYLTDGDKDAHRTVEYAKRRGTPVGVRLVKGAYWDSETVWSEQRGWPCPVWTQKWQSDACYERMSRILLENHEHIHSAFASHNIRSLCHALALCELLDVPQQAFEWQMLYGMGNPMKRAAVQMGQRCRVYTPFGEMMSGMAYFIRRLLENTANESFLRHTGDEASEPALLADPEENGREPAPPAEPVLVRYEFEEPIMDPFQNAPDTDFALQENRQRMLTALGQVRAEMGQEYPLLIAGQALRTDQWYESLNPSRPKETVGKVAQADQAAVERAVAAAADAFKHWRGVAPAERAGVLFKVAEVLEAQRFQLAALAVLECGKPWREADADISEAIDYCNYYGREMIRVADHVRRRDIAGEINEYYYAPRGVVAVMSHWNFPAALAINATAAAIVTGNTVVLQPANQASVMAARLVSIFEQAGLPAGVLNYLPGTDEGVGDALVQHRHVSIVAFTGNYARGRRIYELAAAQPGFKKVIAETGGKNGIIIDSDADLDAAIKGVLECAFGYAGQKCSACSRAIVVAPAYDRFVERLLEAARSKGTGPADEPTTAVPPVIDKAAFERISAMIAAGKQEATCAVEIDAAQQIEASGGGFYIGPTVFTDVRPDARVAREEVFGPVLAIIKVADIEEAIRVFNDCDYALTGGIYSRSPANLERARGECACGNFYINRGITGAKVDLQPFGGFRSSGVDSKVGGPDYLLQFCEPRTITENTLRRGFAPSEEVQEAVS